MDERLGGERIGQLTQKIGIIFDDSAPTRADTVKRTTPIDSPCEICLEATLNEGLIVV